MSSPALEALMAVQDLDTELSQARHRLAHLPERAELDGVLGERHALAGERGERGAARDDVVSRQSALEQELAATEARTATVSRRLYSGEVVASRDLQALSAETEALKARASSLEDRILVVMEEREPLDAAVAALDARDGALAAQEVSLRSRLEEAELRASAEIGALDAGRAALVAAVPSELLATYDRLRARLGGVGAARLVGGHCDGCHLELPATELDRVRHLPADVVVHCDQCGRILVRP
jgi:predicted  nucleic acid-binding Zn-ribbon protein